MKKAFTLIFLIFSGLLASSQTSFTVGGDADKFYPVVFTDGNWESHVPTEVQIGRSDTHQGGQWFGSFLATLTFHCTRWGHGSNFINIDMIQGAGTNSFIAGYWDASVSNASRDVIVWLKGNRIYNYKSNAPQSPIIYDGVQNTLPFQELNGPAHTFKTSVDIFVNSNGISHVGSIYTLGSAPNYINGNLGIGALDTKGYKLAVNGSAIATSVTVKENSNWPDYVFEKEYDLMPLAKVKQYVDANHHLPEVPSGKEIERTGLNLGDMDKILIKKVEELTLYLIDLKKDNEVLKKENERLKSVQEGINEKLKRHHLE